MTRHVSRGVVTFVAGPSKGRIGINDNNFLFNSEADKDLSMPSLLPPMSPPVDEASMNNLELIHLVQDAREAPILTAVNA